MGGDGDDMEVSGLMGYPVFRYLPQQMWLHSAHPKKKKKWKGFQSTKSQSRQYPLESQGVAFLRLITNRTSASYINGVCQTSELFGK